MDEADEREAVREGVVRMYLHQVVQGLDEELLRFSPPGGVPPGESWPAPRWLRHAWAGRWQLAFALRELAKVSGDQGTG